MKSTKRHAKPPRTTEPPTRDRQPTKAEMEDDVSIDATPEELVDAIFNSGAPRRKPPAR